MCPPVAAVREQLLMQAREGDSHRASECSCVATGSTGGTWEHTPKRRAVPRSSAFCGWNDTSTHQLGTQPGFMFWLTSERLHSVFTRLLMLAKARLCSHIWLFLTDPGELLGNLWGVCQLDRKELPWLSFFLFVLLLWPPGSNHFRA